MRSRCKARSKPVTELQPVDLCTTGAFEGIETLNHPTVVRGGVKCWPASKLWAGPQGLLHLKNLAGTATLQVMSSADGVYYGDMQQRTSLSCTFAEFLATSTNPPSSHSTGGTAAADDEHPVQPARLAHGDTGQAGQLPAEQRQQESHRHWYLAQAPLQSSDPGDCPLAPLLQDLHRPAPLAHHTLSHINLWMCTRGSQSSLHYDPYHNYLCLVRGRKRVRLYSPAATRWLYPLPLYGESPNHSAVDFANPDSDRHPLYVHALEEELCCTLEAGDAMFIPEGWWHQVSSDGVSIAVNYWWQSAFEQLVGSHMDAYYLRRITTSLLEKQRAAMLDSIKPLSSAPAKGATEVTGLLASTAELNSRTGLLGQPNTLEPNSLNDDCRTGLESNESDHKRRKTETAGGFLAAESHLRDLQSLQAGKVTAVSKGTAEHELSHEHGGQQQHADQQPTACLNGAQLAAAMRLLVLAVGEKLAQDGSANAAGADVLGLEDGISRVLAALEPEPVRAVLAAMAAQVPRSLEALLLHALPPAAAELLTQKLEAVDAAMLAAGRQAEVASFYEALYGVVRDRKAALDTLLMGKEAFSALACRQVVQDNLLPAFGNCMAQQTLE